MLPLTLPVVVLAISLPTIASPAVHIRSSLVTLPFALKLNYTGTTIADRDRARAAQIVTSSKDRVVADLGRRQSSIAATNTAVTYVASVGVGSPATDYTLLIDTGSSNTWVGAGKAYVVTSTSFDTGDSVSVSYGSGSFSGTECKSRSSALQSLC